MNEIDGMQLQRHFSLMISRKLFRLAVQVVYFQEWYFVAKKLLKFKAEGQESSKILRSLEQNIQTVTGMHIFCNRMLFQLVLINWND